MKLIAAARAFGAALGFVLLGGLTVFAVLPAPTIQGPSLGDANTNIYSLQQAVTLNNQLGFSAAVTAGAANVQSTCTALVNPVNNVTSSVANGSLCLPTATGGRVVQIGNGSGQTLNIFGSNSPFTSGTADTINGTAGTSAYTSVTSGKNADCFAPANGVWFCTAGN